MLFNRKDKISLKALEESLKRHSHVWLQDEKRAAIKRNLIAFTKSYEPSEEFGCEGLINKIRKAACQLRPREYFKTLLREKLITLVEFQKSRITMSSPGEESPRARLKSATFFNLSRLLVSKKLAASFVAFLFVFTLLFNFTFRVEKAQASMVTTLKEATGDVSVVRDSNVLRGENGMLLKADDVIKTGAESEVIIQFLDQSVSRLDENTEVKISKLFVNPLNRTETVVEVVLQKGRMWARVVNLIDNFSHFQVRAENTVAVAKRKAAFDVKILPKGQAKVSAIQNRVDLLVATPDKKVVETSLTKGFSAEVEPNDSVAPKILSEDGQGDQDAWISTNLEKDKRYIEDVKQEAQEQIRDGAKILPGNPMYLVKELSESTNIVLTLNDLDKQKKIIAMARGKLAEAEILLERGETEKAMPLLKEFQRQMAAVSNWIKLYEAISPAAALQFKIEIYDVLNGYQKQLTLMLPHEPLYKLKQTVEQTQILIASNPVEKTQAMISQASNKLLEAHDLAENGDAAAAAVQVAAYSESVNKIVSDVKHLPNDAKDKVVSEMLDTKVDDLKVLEAIGGASAKTSGASAQIPASGGGEGAQAFLKALQEGSTSALLSGGSTTPLATSISGGSAVGAPPPPSPEAPAQPVANAQNLKKTVSDVRTETLTKLGEAVFDAQRNKQNVEVLRKVREINKMDVNGKPFVGVTVSPNNVLIRSDEEIISITRRRAPQIIRPAADQPSVGQSAANSSVVGSTAAAQSTAGASASQSTSGQPAASQPSVGQSSSGQPTAPAANTPPVGEQPAAVLPLPVGQINSYNLSLGSDSVLSDSASASESSTDSGPAALNTVIDLNEPAYDSAGSSSTSAEQFNAVQFDFFSIMLRTSS